MTGAFSFLRIVNSRGAYGLYFLKGRNQLLIRGTKTDPASSRRRSDILECTLELTTTIALFNITPFVAKILPSAQSKLEFEHIFFVEIRGEGHQRHLLSGEDPGHEVIIS